MKKMIVRFAVIAAMLTASTGFASAQILPGVDPGSTLEILIKEILTPANPGPRSVVMPYSTASINIDMGIVTVEFNRKIENISIIISHSSLGSLGTTTMDYDYERWIAIPIIVEEGTYTITISGDDYQGIGYFDNY